MALLRDVPKYGFSTAFSLIPPPDKKSSAADEGGDTTTNKSTDEAKVDDTNSSQLYQKITEKGLVDLIEAAWRLGCRHFDCAPQYGTQKLVGQTLRKLMRANGVKREDVFITSRVPVSQMKTGEMIEKSFRSTLAELQQTHIDLFIVQSPGATGGPCHYGNDIDHWPRDAEGNLQLKEAEDMFVEAFKKLHDLKKTGLTRFIGACNVTFKQLDRIREFHTPDVVQSEYHLYSQDRELFDYCEECDVHFEALVTRHLIPSSSLTSTGSSSATAPSSGGLQVSSQNSNKTNNQGTQTGNNSAGNSGNSGNSGESKPKLPLPNESKQQLTPNSKLSAAARLADPLIDRIAAEYNLTRPQILIQWIHFQPLSYILHTPTVELLEESIKAISLPKLPVNDLIELDSLETNIRPQLVSQTDN